MHYHSLMPKGAEPVALDAVIFGGGAAGLWLLDVLVTGGHGAVLLEADRLGAGQTICAQGIIHGGLKYSLDGALSGSARAIRDMPALWRRCLAGDAVPSLRRTRLRAEQCHLWRTGSVRSRLGMFGARLGLRSAPRVLDADDRPAALRGCPGPVAAVDEPVIDPGSLLEDLAGRRRDRIARIDPESGLDFELEGPGRVRAVEIGDPSGGDRVTLVPRRVILTAGAGNAALAVRLGLRSSGRQQERPLHMLLARGDLPELNGHCVDGTRTRVTITSVRLPAGGIVWQVGGQLAEDGVRLDREALCRRGADEVRAVLPGLDLDGVEWSAYRIDRAEAAAAGVRPSDFTVQREGNVIVGWPTKLALVPRLAEQIAADMDPPAHPPGPVPELSGWTRPEAAEPPWETQTSWYAGL